MTTAIHEPGMSQREEWRIQPGKNKPKAEETDDHHEPGE